MDADGRHNPNRERFAFLYGPQFVSCLPWNGILIPSFRKVIGVSSQCAHLGHLAGSQLSDQYDVRKENVIKLMLQKMYRTRVPKK